MFLPNDVIQYTAPVRTLRILWIDRERALAATFELGRRNGQPHTMALQVLADDVLGRRARLLLHDPYAAPPAPPDLPPKHLALRDKAWDIVACLQAEGPALYQARARAALVARCAEAHGVSRPSVLRYLRRYWERGQVIDALLPDYGNSGARGKTRGASAGVKRGRPRKPGQPAGLNIDAATRAVFSTAVARYRASHGDFSRRAAYRQMLAEFYPACEAGTAPSFGQFSYWLERDGCVAANGIGVAAVQHGLSA
ncbi:hypothetical protein [Massilia sp. 9096]|uniref:hypothetical protein n=1 Tax=Massilia sp. 9096 TaxID=1500894 RepID=UPI000560B355|nr:hypothetical protein [Massilia sp. 9096]